MLLKDLRSKSGIYSLTFGKDKQYIGSAVDLYRRFYHHLPDLRHNKHYNAHLQNAFNKYGEEKLDFKVLFFCDLKSLIFYEQRAIDAHDWSKLYNLSPTADSPLGTKHTEESKRRMSKAAKGRVPWNKGVPCSEEQRRAVSKANKGNQVWLGRSHSDETRKKMSAAALGRPSRNRKSVRIGSETFETTKAAAKAHSVSDGLVRYRVKSQSPKYSDCQWA